MSESSSEETDCDWVFYYDRPEWRDVKPIPQEEGPQPVAAIAYTQKFKDVYDYFRAVLKSNEYSDRALELTKDALLLNAANYTVWQYRRIILKELNKNLDQELIFSKSMILSHQKNYQVWHHRMIIVQWMNNPGNELRFISQMLKEDPKNYHAWQYRQWIITTFNLFNKELEYTAELLEEDIRNNSAWNHRFFVVDHLSVTIGDGVLFDAEIPFTIDAIKKAKNNESSWNYLRGILPRTANGYSNVQVVDFVEDLYCSGNRSPQLLGFLIEIASENAASHPRDEKTIGLLQRAILISKELAEEFDTIRHNYWMFISRVLEGKLKDAQSN